MKPINYLYVFAVCLGFSSCIKDDVIDDRVDPVLQINNPLETLAVGEFYQLRVTYLNNIGQEEVRDITWNSSDDEIASVDTSGRILGHKEGTVIITASTQDSDNNSITAQDAVIITDNTSEEITIREGTIVTTSSYTLTGTFTLETIEEDSALRISVNDNYSASSSLPGLYLYLTNNPNSINGAYEVGAVTVFSGAHTYNIPATEVSLNQYNYLLYWCKPFSVKVGEGKIE